MSSAVKLALKACKKALDEQDYKQARLHAETAMRHDAKNYQACVYYGLACQNLNFEYESVSGYRKAIALQPEHPVAWLGLCKCYEHYNRKKELLET